MNNGKLRFLNYILIPNITRSFCVLINNSIIKEKAAKAAKQADNQKTDDYIIFVLTNNVKQNNLSAYSCNGTFAWRKVTHADYPAKIFSRIKQ